MRRGGLDLIRYEVNEDAIGINSVCVCVCVYFGVICTELSSRALMVRLRDWQRVRQRKEWMLGSLAREARRPLEAFFHPIRIIWTPLLGLHGDPSATPLPPRTCHSGRRVLLGLVSPW